MFFRVSAQLTGLTIAALVVLIPAATSFAADDKEKAKAVTEENGKNLDAAGNPTFKIQEDGTVDWYTFSGFRRFNSDCHVCHGPDGVGSSYAPALAESIKVLDYPTFLSIVAEGRKNLSAGKENVMPAFGDNKNVYCYLDDLYVYLRARAVGDLPRGRPAKKAEKTPAYKEAEAACMGG
jgi:methanol metabolism-related c-type cytochrome